MAGSSSVTGCKYSSVKTFLPDLQVTLKVIKGCIDHDAPDIRLQFSAVYIAPNGETLMNPSCNTSSAS
jgi:hypothetical protein